ncbi:orotate phosphoribosyltransferase [Candidatus Bathyarchaeota archaeon]|nr:MAG: orotate phosphoribosyltransferase [Candidatus Bathyarchaeota archaeon]
MAEPNIEKLALTLAQLQALKFGSFRLTSGRQSPYYIDLRVIPSHPKAFRLCMEAYRRLAEKVGLENFDVVAGIPTTGMIYASILAYQLGKPLVYVRKEVKSWGLGREMEGHLEKGARILLVDDLVTTGKSLLEAADALERAGGKPVYAVVLVDREEGGRENLERRGITLQAYTRITELLKVLRGKGILGEETFRRIEAYIKGEAAGRG